MSAVIHQRWMALALRLARRGLYSTDPNPRVGCVVVSQGELVAQGWHEFSGGPHAEINAINAASIAPASDFYVTLEPCSHQGKTPPCVDALIDLKPARVVIAMQDPNPLVSGAGIAKLKAAGIEVILGVMETEARALNCGFISRMTRKKPFLRLKMATSLDGRSALHNGMSRWITGSEARLDVQKLRARSSAILSSARTVIADDASLDLRLSSAELGQARAPRQPVRVILDATLALTGNEKMFRCGGKIWIYTLSRDSVAQARLSAAGAEITVFDDSADGRIDLDLLMSHLAVREVNEVHCECGATLAGALIQGQLVDELVLYMAPHLLGSGAQGAFDLGLLSEMDQRVQCHIDQVRKVGKDLRLTLRLEQSKSCQPS